MCDYYAFACRFQCLPETHHFSSNLIFHIVAYIWLITNDGIPSPYEHRVNYSKKFIFISILAPYNDIAKKIFPLKSQLKNSTLQPVCHSHYMWKVNIFTVELIKFTSLPTLLQYFWFDPA